MKILLLTDKLGRGGAETHVVTLATELKRAGQLVAVASAGGELEKLLAERGIVHISLPLDKKTPSALLVCRAALDRLAERFDMIHSHARLPSFLADGIAKKHKIPLLCTAHACFSLSRGRKALSRWGERTVAVSEDLKQYLIEGYSLPSENITVIPNPIELSSFPVRSTLPDIPTVAFLSRLEPDCSLGAILLCEVAERLFSRFGKIRIKIGGGGAMLGAIREHAKKLNRKLGFECISTVGEVRDTKSFLSDVSVFVGVSRAAMEAAVSGIPVVICGNEGFGGRLSDENFASLSHENFCARGRASASAESLYDELCAVLTGNGDGQAVCRLMRAHTDSKGCAERTLRIYSELCEKKKDRRADLLLCGYYGFSNMGDDALLRSAIKKAREKFPDLSVAALTKKGRRDSSRFGVRCINRYSLPALTGCKHLIFGGGTLLQDGTSLRSLLYYASLLILAKRFGARCYLWGNGLGPLKSKAAKRFTARAIEVCDAASFRDIESFSLAKQLCPDGNISMENDLALDIAPADSSRAEFILKRMFGESVPRFIIAAPKKAEGVSELRRELIRARRSGYSLLFVAMHEKEDSTITKLLCRECGGRYARGIGYSDLLALARLSDGVYSMRLHGLIAAKSVGVPYKRFGNEQKLKWV